MYRANQIGFKEQGPSRTQCPIDEQINASHRKKIINPGSLTESFGKSIAARTDHGIDSNRELAFLPELFIDLQRFFVRARIVDPGDPHFLNCSIASLI